MHRENIKIESCDAHYRVVEILLPLHKDICWLVPDESEIVVRRANRPKELWTRRKQRYVLNIGIVFLILVSLIFLVSLISYSIVSDKMVDIVTAFPPSYGESAAKIRNEYSDQCVVYEVFSYASMSSIMSGEHNLMLRESVNFAFVMITLTQNKPKAAAEVMYHPLVRVSKNSPKMVLYLAISFAYCKYRQS